MKKTLFILMLASFVGRAALAAPQEKPKASETPKSAENPKTEERASSPTPLRVQVVFAEFDGDKKIVSLPYSFSVNADDQRRETKIRDGVRLPVQQSEHQYNIVNVGTNIDCWAQSENGRYKLVLTVERNFVSGEPAAGVMSTVRDFRAEMSPILKDGQTYEAVTATDPANGHVYRVAVTLTVPK